MCNSQKKMYELKNSVADPDPPHFLTNGFESGKKDSTLTKRLNYHGIDKFVYSITLLSYNNEDFSSKSL